MYKHFRFTLMIIKLSINKLPSFLDQSLWCFCWVHQGELTSKYKHFRFILSNFALINSLAASVRTWVHQGVLTSKYKHFRFILSNFALINSLAASVRTWVHQGVLTSNYERFRFTLINSLAAFARAGPLLLGSSGCAHI